MTLQIVHFRTSPDRVAEVEDAMARLFAGIERAAPVETEYTAARIGDGPEFLLSLRLPEGAANPLPEIPEAAAFRERIAEWAGGPVPPKTVRVLGRYQG